MFISHYPKSFWLLCVACLLFFGSFTMVLSDMPDYLEKLGRPDLKWLIIPAFAITALLSRPFSGKLSDTIGRVPVMLIGAIVTTIACSMYLAFNLIWIFFVIRAFHGFCAGFTPTGFTAYGDDIVPIERRGEAMGLIGICNNIGNAGGWVLGSSCTKAFSMNVTFLIASFLGVLSFIIFKQLKEVIPTQKVQLHQFSFRFSDFFEKRVLLPGIVMIVCVFSSGAILALIADFSAHIKIQNKGLYMLIYISFSLVVRFFAGRWSDQYGRQKISFFGVILLAFSMLALAYSTDIKLYFVSSVLFGLAFGLLSPSLFAWAVDLSEEGKKGKAVGTLFIFLELGIILGSAIGGLIYNNNPKNFYYSFMLCFILCVLLAFFMVISKQKK